MSFFLRTFLAVLEPGQGVEDERAECHVALGDAVERRRSSIFHPLQLAVIYSESV